MASEEDLLSDIHFKDLGELEELDDDAENALLGDSDDEGTSKSKDSSVTASQNKQHEQYAEEEYEYVDEDGNPVEIGENDDVEYVEIEQDGDEASVYDESAGDYVLDLVVDADLEFDDSAVQENNENEQGQGRILQNPWKKQSNDDQHKQPQAQPSQKTRKPRIQRQHLFQQSQQEQQQQQQSSPLSRQRPNLQRQQQQQQPQPQQILKQQLQQHSELSKQQERYAHKQHVQSYPESTTVNIKNSKIEQEINEPTEPEYGYSSVEDNEADSNAIKGESSESDDEENSGRGRFRTERPNVVHLSAAKKRSNIPDSLDGVIVHDEPRLGRVGHPHRGRDYGRSNQRDRSDARHRDRSRNKGRERNRSRERPRISASQKETSSHSQSRHLSSDHLTHMHSNISQSSQSVNIHNLSEIDETSHDLAVKSSNSSFATNAEAKAPRKILINPHFKRAIGSAGAGDPSWDNRSPITAAPFSSEHHLNQTSNVIYPPQQPSLFQQSGSSFNDTYGGQISLSTQPPVTSQSVAPPQYQFGQPPPNKTSQTFSEMPPPVPDFQQRLPSLTSLVPTTTNSSNLLGLPSFYPPPHDPPPPHIPSLMAYGANKVRDPPPGQFQGHSSNDSWNPPSSAHYKPYTVPARPPPLQNLSIAAHIQPLFNNLPSPRPLNFLNVQHPPPPIQRSGQMPPTQSIRPNTIAQFTTPPPNFNVNVGLSTRQPTRPAMSSWQNQQQPTGPTIPIPPNFSRPPPPINVRNPTNFQVPVLNQHPQYRPESGNGITAVTSGKTSNASQFFQPGLHLTSHYKSLQQNTSARPHQVPQSPQLWAQNPARSGKRHPLYSKRAADNSLSISPLKQVKLLAQPLQPIRRKPQLVNTNIKQVQIVDNIPALKNESIISSENSSKDGIESKNQFQTLTIMNEHTESKLEPEPEEEDEETKQYRQQIEMQKKKREEILRLKEQRRIIMAHQRRKQMIQQQILQQQQQKQHQQQSQESSSEAVQDGLLPIPVEFQNLPSVSHQVIIPGSQKANTLSTVSHVPNFSPMHPTSVKKKVFVVRRVPSGASFGFHKPGKPPARLVDIPVNDSLSSLPHIQPIAVLKVGLGCSPIPHIEGSAVPSMGGLQQRANKQIVQQKSVPSAAGDIYIKTPGLLKQSHSDAVLKEVIRSAQSNLQASQQVNRMDGQFIGRQRTVVSASVCGHPQEQQTPINKTVGQRSVVVVHQGGTPALQSNMPKKPQPVAQVASQSASAPFRQVVMHGQVPRRVVPTPNDSAVVKIENLAMATSEAQLRKLCQSVGIVESIGMNKEKRTALVKFRNFQNAKQFMDKFQRKMVDLSLITISLVA